MQAFGKLWDANAVLIGIVGTLLAVAVAIVLNHGTLASVLGLIGGMGFMWAGKPTHVAAAAAED